MLRGRRCLISASDMAQAAVLDATFPNRLSTTRGARHPRPVLPDYRQRPPAGAATRIVVMGNDINRICPVRISFKIQQTGAGGGMRVEERRAPMEAREC